MNGEIVFRHGNDGLNEEVSMETSVSFDPSEDRAIQSGKDDADINTIVRRFGITGNLPEPRRLPEYGDFSGFFDYQDTLNRLNEAQEAFESLPSETRRRFGNSPGMLLEFLNDEANRDEARKMGLLRPEPAPVEPMAVRVVSDPVPPENGS